MRKFSKEKWMKDMIECGRTEIELKTVAWVNFCDGQEVRKDGTILGTNGMVFASHKDWEIEADEETIANEKSKKQSQETKKIEKTITITRDDLIEAGVKASAMLNGDEKDLISKALEVMKNAVYTTVIANILFEDKEGEDDGK